MIDASPNPSPWQRTRSSLARTVLWIGAMLLMIAVLMLGLLLAGGVVLWALLRGRRPAAPNLHWGRMPRAGRFGPVADGEVVDVQVRELDNPTSR